MSIADFAEKRDRLQQINDYKAAVGEEVREDGYLNMLNKVGTIQDNSKSWEWTRADYTSDMQLVSLYEGNGLFAKIIDRPSEDAIAKGIDLSDFGDDIARKIQKKLNSLDFSRVLIRAEKWSRLFGGSIAVMIVNDGRGLEEPLDWDNFTSIEELHVFERAVAQPDYTSMYQSTPFVVGSGIVPHRRWGMPEWYNVYSMYGAFRVHYTRCLEFREGELPEFTSYGQYQYWGIPIYTKIKDALRETITSHQDGTKLLERSSLGVYKMSNLSNLLSTDDGEDKVISRLQVIDMARNIINSMAIDADGEDYSYINASMSGASDIIDRTCNMLSGVTDIPQTILFGRSPAGEDATGDNDMNNYYQLLNRIQTTAYKKPTEQIVKLILLELLRGGKVAEADIPDYDIRFNAFAQQTPQEEANVEQIKANTDLIKANTAAAYINMQALDPSEVRQGLSDNTDYTIQGIVDPDDALDIPTDAFAFSPPADTPTTPAPAPGPVAGVPDMEIFESGRVVTKVEA